MRCEKCGGELPPSAKFCKRCGAQVSQRRESAKGEQKERQEKGGRKRGRKLKAGTRRTRLLKRRNE